MFSNYIKVALRNLARNKVFSVINILGLSIGLTISFLIILYVIDELSYDRFHNDAKDIYRVASQGEIGGQPFHTTKNTARLAPEMLEDFNEVEQYTRIYKVPQTVFLEYNNKKFYEEKILFVDTSFFNIFSFRLLEGDPQYALFQPYSIVLTEESAKKYFGDENPIGKIIRYNNEIDYTVTGIIECNHNKSHIKFDFLASFSTLYIYSQNYDLDQWTSLTVQSYVKLEDNADPRYINKKLHGYIGKKLGVDFREYGIIFISYLQPIVDIHLRSNLMAELEPNGDIYVVFVLCAIALFVLIIASINFMNLSTAKSALRAKEVGMRKVMGASQKKLISQFVGESMILSFIALLISLLFIEFLVSKTSGIIGKDLYVNFHKDYYLIFVFFVITGGIGFFAGSYPAFYIAAFSPLKVLKGQIERRYRQFGVRNLLVVFQYAISIGMIIATLILYKQLNFTNKRSLGFDKDKLIVVPLRDGVNHDELKEAYANIRGVEGATIVDLIPGEEHYAASFHPESIESNEAWLIYRISTDTSYLKVMGIKILEGENFKSYKKGKFDPILINKTLRDQLKWEKPIGKLIYADDKKVKPMQVVGVINDYHFKSFHSPMEPLIIKRNDGQPGFMLMRLSEENKDKTIEKIMKVWTEQDNPFPFMHFELRDVYQGMYGSDRLLGKLFIYLTLLTILIASLGLFGLASFVAEQKRKEIGVRKAMGATITQIIFMLTRYFTKWVIIANLIAWPLAYLGMRSWMQNFEYRTEIPVWIFIVAATIAFLIAILTVGFQAVKSGMTNPAQSLRDEQ